LEPFQTSTRNGAPEHTEAVDIQCGKGHQRLRADRRQLHGLLLPVIIPRCTLDGCSEDAGSGHTKGEQSGSGNHQPWTSRGR
jgi:hypothetical protein